MSSARLGVVVQARLGSTRLPRKALLPLGGAAVIDQVLDRLALIPADAYILATDAASASAFAPTAAAHGFKLLAGSAEDVLSRYCEAIERYSLDRVVRATGDNPLVSPELAALLIADDVADGPADYRAHTGMPLGMGVELVKAVSLIRAGREARLQPEHEHVCPYLYNNPDKFTIIRKEAPEAYILPDARVTVDTQSDYESMLKIYGALYSGRPIPSSAIVDYLRGSFCAGSLHGCSACESGAH